MDGNGRSLDQRVALVTGVSRRVGIGAAIARALAVAGARVFVSYWRAYDATRPWGVADDEPARIEAALRATGADVASLEVDLSLPESAAALVGAVRARFGRLDVLVNDAACSERGDVGAVDAAQLDRHYAVNLRAPLLLAGELARTRPAGEGGRIVNVTSGQGFRPMPAELAYAATKGGLEALTTSLAAALAPVGIPVNAVDPGPTDTGSMPDETKRSLEAASPRGRVGAPEDVARLVAFLASDDAAWVTGQVIRSRGEP